MESISVALSTKKSSLGVIVVCWGLIIWIGLNSVQPLLNLNKFVNTLFYIYSAPLQLVWVISSLILIGFIIGAWQTLKLKEFGRSLIVFLAIIDIPHLVVGKAIYNNCMIQPMYIRNSFLIIIGVLVDLALLYFFNHPKIKQQFV